jgi:hypothetical protein
MASKACEAAEIRAKYAILPENGADLGVIRAVIAAREGPSPERMAGAVRATIPAIAAAVPRSGPGPRSPGSVRSAIGSILAARIRPAPEPVARAARSPISAAAAAVGRGNDEGRCFGEGMDWHGLKL